MNQLDTKRMLIRPYLPSDADRVWLVLRRKEIYDTTYAIPEIIPGNGWIVDPVRGKRPEEPDQL